MLLRRSTARPVLVCLDCRGVSEANLTNHSKQEGLFDFLFVWRFCLFVLLSWRENVAARYAIDGIDAMDQGHSAF